MLSATEGDTITWTVTTTRVPNGTVLYWTDGGSTNSSDWVGGAINGTVTINNNTGTISRTLVTDAVNENNETSILQIRNNSITGTILVTNQTINILNQAFSVTNITTNLATAYDGDAVIWTVTTTGLPTGTVLHWTDSGSTNSSDWVDGAVNGTVIIINNTGTISRVLAGDLINESNETSILQIRTGGINGTIHRTASTVNILEAINEQIYNVPGTYTWTAPAEVTSVSVAAIGGGGAGNGSVVSGGGGGGLGWKNNIAVVPGSTYTVQVGTGGTNANPIGGDSWFINNSTVKGGGGGAAIYNYAGGTGGSFIGDGGGNGGDGNGQGGGLWYWAVGGTGGGGGGYAGNGGNGGNNSLEATSGSSGGGGGGRGYWYDYPLPGIVLRIRSSGGGGTGIGYGQGSNGAGGTSPTLTDPGSDPYTGGGKGGSGGTNGVTGGNDLSEPLGNYEGIGGLYGGGGAHNGQGGSGAVRIIWGSGRSFPNNAGKI